MVQLGYQTQWLYARDNGALYDVKRAGKTPGCPLDRRGQGDGWIGADGPAGDRGRVPQWSHPGHPTANALRYADLLCCRAAQRGWRSAHQLRISICTGPRVAATCCERVRFARCV